MNEDYRKGYRDGFEDGHKAGAASNRNWNTISTPNPTTVSVICPECGMEWKGAMGYVCPNQKCPVQPKVTSYYAQWE